MCLRRGNDDSPEFPSTTDNERADQTLPKYTAVSRGRCAGAPLQQRARSRAKFGASATPTQAAKFGHRRMDNPEDALLTAIGRAREAEENLRETPVDDPTVVPTARKVYQRAEEVGELAKHAADETENGPGCARSANRGCEADSPLLVVAAVRETLVWKLAGEKELNLVSNTLG